MYIHIYTHLYTDLAPNTHVCARSYTPMRINVYEKYTHLYTYICIWHTVGNESIIHIYTHLYICMTWRDLARLGFFEKEAHWDLVAGAEELAPNLAGATPWVRPHTPWKLINKKKNRLVGPIGLLMICSGRHTHVGAKCFDALKRRFGARPMTPWDAPARPKIPVGFYSHVLIKMHSKSQGVLGRSRA